METVTHRVVYLSPAGTTRRVAEAVADELAGRGCDVGVLDLGGGRGAGPGEWLTGVRGRACLWVGSPVYAHHPIPQVLEFVQGLPVLRRGFAAPFVTWGAVSSGTALWDLGVALAARGYGLLGAAAVPAVHSTFWRSSDPPGAGRPDGDDLARVRALVGAVLEKLPAGGPLLAPERLDYQPPEVRAFSEGASLARARAHQPPRRALAERCTRCGACEAACPVGAVTLDPHPRFGPACVLCQQCVRACPEDAIPFDAEAATARIRGLQERFGEAAAVRVFQ